MDSDIAEDVMLSMMKRNILVLPIHDSFLVRSGHYLALRDEMLRAYRDAMQADIKLTIDLSYLDQQQPPVSPTDEVTSKPEDFRTIVEEESKKEEGPYRGYFIRQRIFRSQQPRSYFDRFEPY